MYGANFSCWVFMQRLPGGIITPHPTIVQRTATPYNRSTAPSTNFPSKCPPSYSETMEALCHRNESKYSAIKSELMRQCKVAPAASVCPTPRIASKGSPAPRFSLQMLCCHCWKSAPFLCSGCKLRPYCSAECQVCEACEKQKKK